MASMTDVEDRPPPTIGAYWVKEEEYPALLKMFDDGNNMPQTWKEWLKMPRKWSVDSRLTDTSLCVSISTLTHFRTGAPPMARARAVKDAKGSSLRL
jgi:hypothetical protein